MRTLSVICLACMLFACSKKDSTVSPPIDPVTDPVISSFLPDTGSEATIVTINGTSFSNDTSKVRVQFNGITAIITSATATQIIAIVPPGATSGKLSVTVNNKRATSAVDFIIVPLTWVRKADFGGAGRQRASGFAIGGTGYIVGGFSNQLKITPKDFWAYDAASNSWTKKADFPGNGREFGIAFSINGKGYFGLGYDDPFRLNPEGADFWEYDPATDQWTKKRDVPFITREAAVGFAMNGKGYVGLGTNFNYSTQYRDFWEYDPAIDTWTKKADYPGDGIFLGTGFSINGLGYVGFGASSNVSKQFWEYNASSNTWSRKADLPASGRTDAIGFAIGNKGYVGFGHNVLSDLNDFWEYDPATDQWKEKRAFPGTARYDLVGFSIGNTGYIGTGNPGSYVDFWQFNP